jgi:hypothetical protein
MARRLFVFLAILACMSFHPVYAAGEFSKNNPDIKKFEFARSYITALSYVKDIYGRWNKNTPQKLFAHQDLKMIKAILNDLALDNSDLRVIKDYLLKYLNSPNMLMRKVADTVVVATSQEIAVNDQEKLLWDKWYGLIATHQATRTKEISFVKTQYALDVRRKQIDTDIIRASVLMTKVLMSDKNKNEHGHLLAITSQQRQKLLDKLDSFGGDYLDWGLKSGQRTLEGSVSVIREVLEDSVWISIDEK